MTCNTGQYIPKRTYDVTVEQKYSKDREGSQSPGVAEDIPLSPTETGGQEVVMNTYVTAPGESGKMMVDNEEEVKLNLDDEGESAPTAL